MFEEILTDERDFTTAKFNSNDVAEINMLKRAILSEIETVAIHSVIFYYNNSAREDELMAFRLGQLVLDNDQLDIEAIKQQPLRVRVDISGPVEMTTEHIPNLPFKYKTPIIKLREGERIFCDIIAKVGQGKDHVRWRPVSRFAFSEIKDGEGGIIEGYNVKMKGLGMMDPEKILQKGYEKIESAANRVSANIFSLQLRPANL